jgi:hypothetical protein
VDLLTRLKVVNWGEIKMRKLLLALVCLQLLPNLSWADWSDCQTVTAVSNYIAYSNTVALALYPGIPGCNSDVPGGVMFRVGQMNVSSDSLKSLLASSFAAHLAGKRVMIFFDPSTQYCFANAISLSGYGGQCP